MEKFIDEDPTPHFPLYHHQVLFSCPKKRYKVRNGEDKNIILIIYLGAIMASPLAAHYSLVYLIESHHSYAPDTLCIRVVCFGVCLQTL